MATPEISDNIKRNVRSVLLSKYDGKGILVGEFLQEYKRLLKEPLHFKSLGFETLQKFIEAMPDVIRLDYSNECMGYKMFAVQNPNAYMSLSAKRALGRNGDIDRSKQGRGRDRREEAEINGCDDVPHFKRGRKGLYSVCFPNKPTNGLNTSEDVIAKFSEAGNVADVNIIQWYTFVRFEKEAEAAKALQLFKNELNVRVADEKDTEKDKVNGDSRHRKMEDGEKGKFGMRSPKGKDDLLISPKEESSKSVIEVYIGNIYFDSSKEELERLLSPFQIKELRIKRENNKMYAFVSFLDIECARACCQKMNKYMWKGRNLNARLAHEPREYKDDSSDAAEDVLGRGYPTDKLARASLNNDGKLDVTEKLANLTVHAGQGGKRGVTMSNDDDMPPLEHILHNNETDDMPELELTETIQTPNEHRAGENGVQMLIGNFPYGTSESELMLLFKKFGAEEIFIMNTTSTNRSTYAFTRVADVAQAKLAVIELDKSIFHGRRLMVGIADRTYQEKTTNKPALLPTPNISFVPHFPQTQIPAHTYHSQQLPQQFPQHMTTVGSMPGISPIHSPGRFSTPNAMGAAGTGPKQGDQMMIIGCFNPSSWDEILHTYMVVVHKLRGNPRDYYFPQSSQILVQITSVYDSSHFWAHVVQNNKNLEAFERIMTELQNSHSRLSETSKLGRCAAVYDGDFYRGWIMGCKDDMVTVFYIDYGNVGTMRRAQTSTTTSPIWTLPPLAKPFKLTKPISDFKNHLESHLVKLEVIQSGSESTAYTSEVRIVEVMTNPQS
ncbi:hypothetical protein CHS0354_030831 [Potamilus streckersoni]|uniref:Uncharacterized protein n=1 Tax=Potamilus streckersoni TaxID=2493646 RepID=A0AAE0WBR0_9BIVA|nr:hypothetical protein CHS0354_030831 [Potamilus streckersoni]